MTPEQLARRATHARARAFLAAYRLTASITRAAAAAGCDRTTHYAWMRNARYREAFERSAAQAGSVLEDEAIERATVGVYEPNIYQGEFVYPQELYEVEPAVPAEFYGTGSVRKRAVPAVTAWRDVPGAPPLGVWKKSDGLLQFLLRGVMPAKYRSNGALEISGPQGGPIPLEQQRLAVLNDDELASLIAVAQKLTAPRNDGSGADAPGPA